MRISACIITKNGGASLIRCIESIKQFVNEIVVVDTGSIDATVRMASKLGAKVYNYPYEVFSYKDAKNFAIDNATGDWILSIDSDEALSCNYGQKLRKLAQKGNCKGYALLVQNYYPNGRWSSFPVTKFFIRNPAVRYEKDIHETVNYALQRIGCVPEIKGIYIHHYGYLEDPDTLKQKAYRYYDLLEKQLKATPDDAASWWYLALSTAALGKLHEAIDIVHKAIHIEPQNKIPRLFLARFYMGLQDYTKAIGVLEQSLSIREQEFWNPTIYNLLGMLHLTLGNKDNAINCLNEVIKVESDFAHAWVNLGIAYEQLENWEQALECYLRAAQLNPVLLELKTTQEAHLYSFQEDVSSLYRGLSEHINYCSKKLGCKR
ncbi:Glycosyltransferase involved in cell wall bisynthesis [Caldanaerobius fijiensis DSM 17918]|uniref:Glycosyltransferase involved in cell wall bisynthesis n=1 Tax=Caldanaerobius fijiensis DSM 17918 TaxID=1121256 RepID=A0A1M5C568_9THEO|nr:glycosyltransferase family 2 protein [Caldanaerobius fijiensis]SHF49898.1 Glycosyltransferase involved in cell wall bisynthesis [Caldanaerobius fijiensis DSM 17918]